jgi:hypothetical protein
VEEPALTVKFANRSGFEATAAQCQVAKPEGAGDIAGFGYAVRQARLNSGKKVVVLGKAPGLFKQMACRLDPAPEHCRNTTLVKDLGSHLTIMT